MRITKDLREWAEFQDDCARRLQRSTAWVALGLAAVGVARAPANGAAWEAAAPTVLLLGLSTLLGGRRKLVGGWFLGAWLVVAFLEAVSVLGR